MSILVLLALLAADPTGTKAYDSYREPWRTHFTQDWQQAITEAEKELKELGAKARDRSLRAKDRKGFGDQGRKLRRSIAQLKKNDPPYFRELRNNGPTDNDWGFGNWQVGSYGVFTNRGAVAFQIIDGDSFLALCKGYSYTERRIPKGPNPIPSDFRHRVPETFAMFKGFSTAGMKEDFQFTIVDTMVRVTGNTTYTTVTGATKTVIVVEPLTISEISVKQEEAG